MIPAESGKKCCCWWYISLQKVVNSYTLAGYVCTNPPTSMCLIAEEITPPSLEVSTLSSVLVALPEVGSYMDSSNYDEGTARRKYVNWIRRFSGQWVLSGGEGSMGVCPPDWMLLVGVLRITGTLLYSKRHSPKLGMCLLLCELMIALRFKCKCGGSRLGWICADVQFVVDFS